MRNVGRTRTRVVFAVSGILFLCAAAALAVVQEVLSPPAPPVLDRKSATGLIVSQIKPDYPPIAKINFIQGLVRLQIRVSPEGRVTGAHVVRGHPFLAVPALKAVRRWVYRPFRTGSGPAEFTTFVDVNFALRTPKIDQLPPRPEQDLSRQVHPPELLAKAPGAGKEASVRLHILVNDDGQVIDWEPVGGVAANFLAAEKQVAGWNFRPARWGNHSVPWYLDVDVPVDRSPQAPREDSAADHSPPPP
jgi:TonB family protein